MSSTTAILLAAGRGTRLRAMGDLPKPLTPANGEPVLVRALRQLHEIGIRDFVVVVGHRADLVGRAALDWFPAARIVENARFAEDRNILSLLLGMREVPEGHAALVVEGDVILSDTAVIRLQAALRGGESVWTACGGFQPWQTGGILRADADGALREIRYAEHHPSLSEWRKNLGCILVAAPQVAPYRRLLEEYAARSLDTYFMTPWAEHLADLPARVLDLGGDGGIAFNTPEEYARAADILRGPELPPGTAVELVATADLRHIEGFDPERARLLAEKIAAEGVWTAPLVTDRTDLLVMDGQHRMEAARRLGLRRVPAVRLDYESTPVFSLRPECEVSVAEIRRRAASGDIYPYKTAKHVLPSGMPSCRIPLSELE